MRVHLKILIILFTIDTFYKNRITPKSNFYSFDSKFTFDSKHVSFTKKSMYSSFRKRRSNMSAKTCLVMGSVNAGFCNQLWRFTGFIFLAAKNNCSFVLIENMYWKDTHGTNKFIPHDFFFDVDHWNNFHQDLPSFTAFNSDLDIDISPLPSKKLTILSQSNETYFYNYRPRLKYNNEYWKNSTKPVPIAHVNPKQSLNIFKQTMKSISVGRHPQPNENLYRFILSGALQPHPYLEEIVQQTLRILKDENGFMTIHMRTEPDMLKQQHICSSKRVSSVKYITKLIYDAYPEPPVKSILLPVALDIMEKMEQNTFNKSTNILSKIELLNRQNLAEIRKLQAYGMYDGKVKVFLAGSRIVEEISEPYYSKFKVFTGSVLNYYIAIESKIFVGTETSSWSSSISNARLFRGHLENYFFDTNGLHHITPYNDSKPHRFIC